MEAHTKNGGRGHRMKNETGVPFVALFRKLLSASEPAGPEHHYDGYRQLWLCARTGEPLVMLHLQRDPSSMSPTEFGETVQTRTAEGIDQSEGRIDADFIADRTARPRGISASPFGETIITETQEGTDQSERTVSGPCTLNEGHTA